MDIFDYLLKYNPIYLALFGTIFTWLTTAAGALMVFFFQKDNKKLLNMMLGFAAGVMIAASFWSLLDPAIAMAEDRGMIKWIPAVTGFILGAGFVMLIDKSLPLFYKRMVMDKSTQTKSSWQRSFMLIFAITLHNIPEGLAIGVAFGALSTNPDPALLAGALALTIGIGIQNIPEGAAVSLPLRREGYSRLKAFNYGQLSGIVEPIAGVAGAFLVIYISPILPFALAFAAGAMILVVVKELIPEAQLGVEKDLSTIGLIIGFAVMMALDVALG